MNGAHDMGSQRDMGPLEYEKPSLFFTHLGRLGSTHSPVRCGRGASGISTPTVTRSNVCPLPTIGE